MALPGQWASKANLMPAPLTTSLLGVAVIFAALDYSPEAAFVAVLAFIWQLLVTLVASTED